MTIITIDIKKIQAELGALQERCRQQRARIVLLENAITVARLKHRDDEELEKHFHELMNDDYRPNEIDLAKSPALASDQLFEAKQN